MAFDARAAVYYGGQDPAALVSESWARRYFPGHSAIGRKMVSGGCTSCPLTEVVGVVSDVKYQGLEESNDAVYQTADGSNTYSLRMIARTRGSEDDAIRQLTAAVSGIDSEVLVESTTLEARLGDALSEPRHWTALVGGFAAAAGILAALGVSVRQGVAMHGAFLNVNTDMRYFGRVEVAGGQSMSSLLSHRALPTKMSKVRAALVTHLAEALVLERYHLHTGHPLLAELPAMNEERESAA